MKFYYLAFFFFIACYSNDNVSEKTTESVHSQLSTDVEITLTEMGNVKALVTAELLEKNDSDLVLQLTNNVIVDATITLNGPHFTCGIKNSSRGLSDAIKGRNAFLDSDTYCNHVTFPNSFGFSGFEENRSYSFFELPTVMNSP